MHQIAIYVLVGSTAAFTHLAVARAMVEMLAVHPLGGNLAGFCMGFVVSFGGHSRWTFPTARENIAAARMRFFAVAFTGFVINQAAYAWALQIFGRDYYFPILVAVILGVAAASFVLSKLWAFAQPQN
jgi:putative flippase GtrA